MTVESWGYLSNSGWKVRLLLKCEGGEERQINTIITASECENDS